MKNCIIIKKSVPRGEGEAAVVVKAAAIPGLLEVGRLGLADEQVQPVDVAAPTGSALDTESLTGRLRLAPRSGAR